MDVAWWIWALVVVFVMALLAVDLFVFNREAHEVSLREAAAWWAVWIAIGVGFGGVILVWLGPHLAGEYLAGYLIEYSLSVDNIFVFALLFTYFAVPAANQHRLLFWGIVGAVIFRAIFIFAGSALLSAFEWMFYVFGAFLIYTGIKMYRSGEAEVHPDKNPLVRFFCRFMRVTSGYRDARFIVREGGKWAVTPMLIALLAVESTDVLFATDSIPAVFAVTRHPFLVFTSNIFAVLGLRTLYFLLADLIRHFRHLNVGLSAVLVFVGVKMLISDLYHIPIWASLSFIAVALSVSIGVSLWETAREGSSDRGRAPRDQARAARDEGPRC